MLPAEYACIRPSQILNEAMIPAVLTAGKLIAREFEKRQFSVNQKSGHGDLVTDIDLRSSAQIFAILHGMCPDIPILDEEHGENLLLENGDVSFIVDPMDGTLNFIHGYGELCISIGLMSKGKPLAGVVYNPLDGVLYSGIDGQGAWKNGEPIKAGSEQQLSECLIATGIPYDMHIREEGFMRPLGKLLNQVQELRILGSAALALCYVASGQMSGFFEYGLNPWDVAGGAAIILGAGGVVLPIYEHSDPVFSGSLVAGNAKIGTILRNELST